ncbi:AI-2E family transporter [Roseivirga sp.]|uniref:AI-2E family transporter n=1 Tax=Roseivirga sp. TaxID=1964215 RepID=UPI003B8C93B0
MKTDLTKDNLRNVAYWIIILSGIFISLIYFRAFLEPIVLALIVWYLIRTVRKIISKITVKGKSLPNIIQRVMAFIVTLSLLYGVYQIVSVNVRLISENAESYDGNLQIFIDQLKDFTEANRDYIPEFDVQETIEKVDYQSILSGVFNSVSVLLGNFALVIVYVIFFLIEENYFSKKLDKLFKKEGNKENIMDIVGQISTAVNKYFTVKTEVSLITGVASYLILLAWGVDFPVLWAFLIFILNYIPYIGSLVSSLLPAIFAIFQFAAFPPFLYVFLTVEVVQIFVGNYVEPKLMGRTLNLSPLVVIMALSFWASIWGIMGMILSVPIISVAIIICAQFPSTRGLAIMMTENGNIEDVLKRQ